jgi:phage terminase Nu1 subunit (DNA packaging protein)
VGELKSINALVVELGIPRARLEESLDGVEPIKQNGNVKLYRTRDAVKALGLSLPVGRRKGEAKNEPSAFGEKEKQEIRLKKIQADRQELMLAKSAGEVVPTVAAVKAFSEILVAVKTRLMQIPLKSAARLARMKKAKQIEDELEKKITEALSELSRFNPDRFLGELSRLSGGGGGDVQGDGPAPEIEGGRVGRSESDIESGE